MDTLMGALHADKDGKSAFIWPFWSPTTSAMVIMYSAHQQQWQEAQRFAKTVATQKPNGLYLISILKAFICFYETLRVVSALSVYSHLCCYGVPVCIVCSRQPVINGVGSSPQFLHWNLHTSSCETFSHLAISLPICCFLTQQCKGYAICGNWISL